LGPSAKNPPGREPGGKTQIAEDRADGDEDGVIDKMIGIAALAVGIVLGLVFHPSVPEVIQPYLPIAVVAALDAVFGGLRAYLERIFDPKVFVVSFVFNVLVAALIVYVGDQLGVGTQLSTAIIVVLGIRIFGNTAALRRRLFGA
jgi:small basic protein